MCPAGRIINAGLLVAILVGAILAGCRSVPMTQRKQLLLVPENYEQELGLASYKQVLADQTLSSDSRMIEMVNRVGERLARAASRPDYQWEFQLIASKQRNAFALPGGKVAIYEGILPICGNEAGLAVVMSHEIAHALARHGGERMSQGMLLNAAGTVLKRVSRDHQEHDRKALLEAYGVVSKYGVALPFSRKQESEADRMGLMLMAEAGYDPRVAPLFWQRFAAAKDSSDPPEFLSTHPADARRAADLRQLMPTAIAAYEQATVKHGDGERIARNGNP